MENEHYWAQVNEPTSLHGQHSRLSNVYRLAVKATLLCTPQSSAFGGGSLPLCFSSGVERRRR